MLRAYSRVTLVLVPSSEEFSDIPFMKFWGYFRSFYTQTNYTQSTSFGSRLCVIHSVKLIITFKCIIEHKFDRLQLSFNTG